MDSTEKEGRFHGDGEQARITSLGEVEESSASIKLDLLVWPPPQWGPRGRRTKWPDCHRKKSS